MKDNNPKDKSHKRRGDERRRDVGQGNKRTINIRRAACSVKENLSIDDATT